MTLGRVLLFHPGAGWSTADVEAGLRYGLEFHGLEVVRYRLDGRIAVTKDWLRLCWRRKKKWEPEAAKPTYEQILYEASIPAMEVAFRYDVDAVIIVSGMFVPLDAVKIFKKAGLRVFIVFTESPYDIAQEVLWAAEVDGCWTNERSSFLHFRAVNPNTGYLPHAWHPKRHTTLMSHSDVPAHDVVFVGTAFQERIAWLESVDWTGIDLGLYGNWGALSKRSPLKAFLREGVIDNAKTAALYRRAKVGLNLYRTSIGWGKDAPHITHAESMNPRAYELAACGAFSLSDYRTEVKEVFGDLVPTFTTASEAATLIRRWLPDDVGRTRIAAQLPACVAGSSWVARAATVLGDLQTFLPRHAA